MLVWRERQPLPERCIKCERKTKQYLEADEAEKERMEREEDFNLDCGSCDYALERYYADEEPVEKS
jgi:hypothetical protein